MIAFLKKNGNKCRHFLNSRSIQTASHMIKKALGKLELLFSTSSEQRECLSLYIKKRIMEII